MGHRKDELRRPRRLPALAVQKGLDEKIAGVELRLDPDGEDWRDAPVWTPETIESATKVWFESLGR